MTTSDKVAELEAQLAKAKADLREAQDQEFCTPENVRDVLVSLSKATGGITNQDTMSLVELHAALTSQIKRIYTGYQDSLWPKDNHHGYRGC